MAAMTMVEGIEIGLKQIAEVASNHNGKIKESNRFKLFLRLSESQTTFFKFITKIISLSFFPRLTKSQV